MADVSYVYLYIQRFFMGSVWPATYYYSLLEIFRLLQTQLPLEFGPLLFLTTSSLTSPSPLVEACVLFLYLDLMKP